MKRKGYRFFTLPDAQLINSFFQGIGFLRETSNDKCAGVLIHFLSEQATVQTEGLSLSRPGRQRKNTPAIYNLPRNMIIERLAQNAPCILKGRAADIAQPALALISFPEQGHLPNELRFIYSHLAPLNTAILPYRDISYAKTARQKRVVLWLDYWQGMNGLIPWINCIFDVTVF